MKVKDLIEKLKEMNPEATIAVEICERTETHSCSDVDEVYESTNNTVCIQGYNL